MSREKRKVYVVGHKNPDTRFYLFVRFAYASLKTEGDGADHMSRAGPDS